MKPWLDRWEMAGVSIGLVVGPLVGWWWNYHDHHSTKLLDLVEGAAVGYVFIALWLWWRWRKSRRA